MVRIGFVGENGYIGSYIHDTLIDSQYDVTTFDFRYQTINRTNIADIDVFIYTGGITSRNLCELLPNDDIIRQNIHDVLQIASFLNKSQLLIYFSTAAVYEGYGNTMPEESNAINKDRLDVYSLSMYERENSILATESCNSIGLRLGMTCGISRRQRYDLAFMSMVHSSLHDGKIYLDSNNPYRAILGMSDLYRAIQSIITHKSNITGHHLYNLSSFNIDIKGLSTFISSQLNSSVHAIPGVKSKNSMGFSMDSSKFCRDFSFTFSETKESILLKLLEYKDTFDRFTTKCRICKSSGLNLILDLGNQPLVNNLLLNKEDKSDVFPLNIYGCRSCHHTQLGCTVSPPKMFNFYTYVSGVSESSIKHFKFIAEYLISLSKGNQKSVLEIASNDGCQLDFFLNAGFQTYGVDPAENICKMAKTKGHTIICDFWGNKEFSILPSSFDIILAQNVLAHVPDPIAFVKQCVEYMTDDTILYLQTSQCEMYMHNEFDTIYHEHMSFFTLESFKKMAEICNLTITDTNKFSIHGTSYGLVFQKNKGTHCSKFVEYLDKEHALNMYSAEFYYEYRTKVINFKYTILKMLNEFRANYTIVGYGAAAKGITMLNYINFKYIDYIVDDCNFKYGKYAPGLNIPIVTNDILLNDTRPLLIIILPWNIKNELIQKIQILLKGRSVPVLVPFPAPHIITI